MKNLRNLLILIAISIIISLIINHKSLDKKIEINDKERQEIVNELAELNKQYKEIIKEWIELEKEKFIKQKFKTTWYVYNIDVENMVKRTQSKLWIPYVLGWRWNSKLDCSGLIGWYAYYEKQIISWNEYVNHTNSENISKKWKEKNIENVSRWDLMFFEEGNNGITHIAMVLNVNLEEWRIFVVDSSYWNWVTNRILYLGYSNWYITYHNDKQKRYIVTFTDNPYITNMELIWDFLISSYIPKTDVMDINWWGASWRHTASWLPLKDEYAWEVVACPKQYPFWTRFYIELFWEVICKDRWWLIVMKWDTNSRWNVSSWNRLDIFAWLNTAKIKWNQKHANVYLIK